MPDIFTPDKRSQIMSKIHGKETRLEILVRKFLFSQGFRYRKNDKRYAGKPDIVLPKYKTVVFIHGCFWHGHSCNKGHIPRSNTDFWQDKITKNRQRDIKNESSLQALGFKVVTIWECELKNKTVLESRLNRLVTEITKAV
ncbi:DNA mismatch endonuclease Vsr [Uruburuella suis]|uniref:Very short patch repair endonuclease n=2 Tax=Uruburuella suis TaxID=252130 RepID=A0AAE9GV47_9NEIS|nr:DNA mismatch endonuclease Vsr [Uruburuella suis]UOO79566.1 DNA mismatch endonuclease Vsr [Uruburuella suis]